MLLGSFGIFLSNLYILILKLDKAVVFMLMNCKLNQVWRNWLSINSLSQCNIFRFMKKKFVTWSRVTKETEKVISILITSQCYYNVAYYSALTFYWSFYFDSIIREKRKRTSSPKQAFFSLNLNSEIWAKPNISSSVFVSRDGIVDLDHSGPQFFPSLQIFTVELVFLSASSLSHPPNCVWFWCQSHWRHISHNFSIIVVSVW